MIFVDYGISEENKHYLYLKEINDNNATLLRHLGFEPLDSNNGAVIGEPDMETWVKNEIISNRANMSIQEKAGELLTSIDFSNWKYKWMAQATKLILEYLTLDGLQDAKRASEIPDEIQDIVLNSMPDKEVLDAKPSICDRLHRMWILANWSQYNLVDSREEMVELLNILEKHGETIDALHDAGGCLDTDFCDIMMKNIQNDRDVVRRLKEYNLFFKTEEEFMFYVMETAKAFEESAEDFLKQAETDKSFLDYMKTEDGYVVQLHY